MSRGVRLLRGVVGARGARVRVRGHAVLPRTRRGGPSVPRRLRGGARDGRAVDGGRLLRRGGRELVDGGTFVVGVVGVGARVRERHIGHPSHERVSVQRRRGEPRDARDPPQGDARAPERAARVRPDGALRVRGPRGSVEEDGAGRAREGVSFSPTRRRAKARRFQRKRRRRRKKSRRGVLVVGHAETRSGRARVTRVVFLAPAPRPQRRAAPGASVLTPGSGPAERAPRRVGAQDQRARPRVGGVQPRRGRRLRRAHQAGVAPAVAAIPRLLAEHVPRVESNRMESRMERGTSAAAAAAAALGGRSDPRRGVFNGPGGGRVRRRRDARRSRRHPRRHHPRRHPRRHALGTPARPASGDAAGGVLPHVPAARLARGRARERLVRSRRDRDGPDGRRARTSRRTRCARRGVSAT